MLTDQLDQDLKLRYLISHSISVTTDTHELVGETRNTPKVSKDSLATPDSNLWWPSCFRNSHVLRHIPAEEFFTYRCSRTRDKGYSRETSGHLLL